jgi:hypothetical protein
MAADHFVANGRDHVGEGEGTLLLGHARMEHDLQQQVAQLVSQFAHVAVLDRVGDLVRLLDGVGRDGGEVLFTVPGTAAIRVAELRHDGEEVVDVASLVYRPCSVFVGCRSEPCSRFVPQVPNKVRSYNAGNRISIRAPPSSLRPMPTVPP